MHVMQLLTILCRLQSTALQPGVRTMNYSNLVALARSSNHRRHNLILNSELSMSKLKKCGVKCHVAQRALKGFQITFVFVYSLFEQ